MFSIFNSEGIIRLLYTLPVLLMSIAVHEFAHAFVAYKLGDESQKYRGNLTLDPFKHIDWVGLLCIILCGFGWGKPTQINESKFKNRAKGIMLTALAGPVANLLFALFLVGVLKILLVTGLVVPVASSGVGGILFDMLILSIMFNVVFAVFNMIPLSPFDGGKVLYYFLPYKAKKIFDKIEEYSIYIVLILCITGIGRLMISPIIKLIYYLISIIL